MMLSFFHFVALLVVLQLVLVPVHSFVPNHPIHCSRPFQKKHGIISTFSLPQPFHVFTSSSIFKGTTCLRSISTSRRCTNGNSDTTDDRDGPFPDLSIIGICGAIGTGKSHTSKLLVKKLNSLYMNSIKSIDAYDGDDSEKEGPVAFHIDSDKLSHGVYAPGSLAIRQVEQQFGKDVIQDDGTVNRKALGSIVFNDEKEMAVSFPVLVLYISLLHRLCG